MPRDYKDRVQRKPARSPLPGWAWLIAGLSVGLFVAFVVHLYDQGYRPLAERQSAARPPPTPPSHPAARAEPDQPPPPRFDFYTVLPEMEVVVPLKDPEPPKPARTPAPEEKPKVAREAAHPPGPPVAPAVVAPATTVERLPPGLYVLQAGSFRTHSQADQLRAKLALLGIEAQIQTVSVNKKDTWHRVRVGPFRDPKRLNEVRARLRENNIQAILLKQSG